MWVTLYTCLTEPYCRGYWENNCWPKGLKLRHTLCPLITLMRIDRMLLSLCTFYCINILPRYTNQLLCSNKFLLETGSLCGLLLLGSSTAAIWKLTTMATQGTYNSTWNIENLHVSWLRLIFWLLIHFVEFLYFVEFVLSLSFLSSSHTSCCYLPSLSIFLHCFGASQPLRTSLQTSVSSWRN